LVTFLCQDKKVTGNDKPYEVKLFPLPSLGKQRKNRKLFAETKEPRPDLSGQAFSGSPTRITGVKIY